MMQQCNVVLIMCANCCVWKYKPPTRTDDLRMAYKISDFCILTHSVFKASIPPTWRRGFMLSSRDVTSPRVQSAGDISRKFRAVSTTVSATISRLVYQLDSLRREVLT